jgi:hypothetical protein
MPLQREQRALLQLLCERGQSYEDISGLLGVPADEVRNRARTALSEIGGADPDSEVSLTDFLLGQADPIGRADAARFLGSDPEALDLARRIQEGLSAIAPGAKQAKLPESRGRRRRAALPDSSETPAPTTDLRSPVAAEGDAEGRSGQTRLIAALAAIGVLLVFAILVLAGVFSGGGEDSTSTSSSTASTTGDGTGAVEENITTVPLEPASGSGVAGQAVFGLGSDQQQLFVDIDVQGLDPELVDGQSYLVWLMVGDSAGYPIDSLQPDENGGFSGRLVVPTPIAVAVGNQAESVRISQTSVAKLQSKIEQAAQQEVPILSFVGTELASGNIPLVKQGQGQQGG